MPLADTIFISIASYRDPELIPTIKDMIANAAHPEALHIAICWQDDEDTSLFTNAGMELTGKTRLKHHNVYFLQWGRSQISVISIHYFESQGACWARSMAESLYCEETWFLQVDSHCRFITRWDSEAIAMLNSLKCRSANPVLSTYPPAYKPENEDERSQLLCRLIFREFSSERIPMLGSTSRESGEATPSGYLAGGFVFAPGSYVIDVPNDPQIFFAGEEIAMAARAFTHGYDIYTPGKILLWHFYQRKDQKKVWGDHTNDAKKSGSVDLTWWERDKISRSRVRTVLGIETPPLDLKGYSLGDARTLAEFEACIGLNFTSQTVLPEVIGPESLNYFSPDSYTREDWNARLVHPNKKKITFPKAEIELNHHDLKWWHFGVYSETNTLLEQLMLTRSQLETLLIQGENASFDIHFAFSTRAGLKPWVVRACPFYHRSGWGKVLEKKW